VVAYSRYGYGQSTPLPAGVRNARDARFMHDEAMETAPQVFEKLGIENPYLVGHSDGGSIALIYAATYLGAVSGVAVLAPHTSVEEISVTGIRAAKTGFETTDLPARLAKFHRDSEATFFGWNDVWLSEEFRNWNITKMLSAITAPVLAIQGDADEYGTMAQIEAIKNALPASQLLKLADCGHSPWKEARSIVLDAIGKHYMRCAG
jgi:pimeloyl-ACP methyl ester carboxylesterase